LEVFQLALELQQWAESAECAVTLKQQPKRAKEVLEYFVRNPQAVDTLEGIARWRLLREAVYRGVIETAEALDWLVAEGFLDETATTSSKPIYSLNANAIPKANRLLDEDQSPNDKD